MGQTSVLFFALAIAGIIFGIYEIGGISFEVGRILLFAFLLLSFLTFGWDLICEGIYRKKVTGQPLENDEKEIFKSPFL